MRHSDRAALRALEGQPAGDRWLGFVALRVLTGLAECDLRPALIRLGTAGLVDHEMRVGVRGGVYRAKP